MQNEKNPSKAGISLPFQLLCHPCRFRMCGWPLRSVWSSGAGHMHCTQIELEGFLSLTNWLQKWELVAKSSNHGTNIFGGRSIWSLLELPANGDNNNQTDFYSVLLLVFLKLFSRQCTLYHLHAPWPWYNFAHDPLSYNYILLELCVIGDLTGLLSTPLALGEQEPSTLGLEMTCKSTFLFTEKGSSWHL